LPHARRQPCLRKRRLWRFADILASRTGMRLALAFAAYTLARLSSDTLLICSDI